MKKQINPNIKAHLIRSAFYVFCLSLCGDSLRAGATKRWQVKITQCQGQHSGAPARDLPTPWTLVAACCPWT